MYHYWANNGYRITRHIDCTKWPNRFFSPLNEDEEHKGEDGGRAYREHMIDAWLLQGGMITTSCSYQWFCYGVPIAPSPRESNVHRNTVLYHPQKLWPNEVNSKKRDRTTVQAPILIENPPMTYQQYRYESQPSVPATTKSTPTTAPHTIPPRMSFVDTLLHDLPKLCRHV